MAGGGTLYTMRLAAVTPPVLLKHATNVLLLALASAAASVSAAGNSVGTGATTPTQFVRIVHDADGRPDALQMAIVTYAEQHGAGGFTVDLVGAVHIADRAYYEALNDRFRRYDALLYELILPAQADELPVHTAGANLLSGTQIGMKNVLGLTFQLEEIDYDAPNFIHADLTSDVLAQRMSERGESLYVYLFRLLVASIEDYSRDPFGTKRSQRLSGAVGAAPEDAIKITMAYEMVDAKRAADVLAGPQGSALIEARNEHAVRVLKEQLEDGARHVGIFYGVAHMPDIERRLLEELALTRTGIAWIDAWQLGDDASNSQPDHSGNVPR